MDPASFAGRLRGGIPAGGIWICLADPLTVSIAARSGADYVCIDLQHGFADAAKLPELVAAARAVSSTEVVVRVPWNRPEQIMRALDLGVRTVIVPMVNTAEEARAAVAASRYAPDGLRSWGPMLGDVAGHAPTPDAANRSVSLLVMIETAQALEEIDAILDVPGVDGVYIGPNDLALSLGYGRRTYRESSDVDAAIAGIVGACARRGLPVGLHCSDVDMAHDWAVRGVRMCTIGTDTSLLAAAMSGVVTSFR